MLETIGIYAISVFILIIATGTTIATIKLVKRYQDLISLRLTIIVSLVNIWAISVVMLNIHHIFPILNDRTLITFSRIALICLYFSAGTTAYILHDYLYGYWTMLFAIITIALAVVSISLIFVDWILMTPVFYVFVNTGDQWLVKVHQVATIISMLTLVTFIITIYFSSRAFTKIPEEITYKKNLKLIFISFLSLFVIDLVILLLPILIPKVSTPIGRILGYLLVLNIQVGNSFIIYAAFQQPFLHIGGFGVNPDIIVDRDLVGYFLGLTTARGPIVSTYNKAFAENFDIELHQLQTLNIGATSLIGIDNSFQEEIAIFPFPKQPDLIVVLFSFMSKNQETTDSRLKDRTPTIFGLILPSIMTVGFHNIKTLTPRILRKLREYQQIQELNQKQELQKLTKIVLRELLF